MLRLALEGVHLLRKRYAALQRSFESAVRVLACFKSSPEKRLQVAALVAEIGWVRRTVQNALVSLTKENLSKFPASTGYWPRTIPTDILS